MLDIENKMRAKFSVFLPIIPFYPSTFTYFISAADKYTTMTWWLLYIYCRLSQWWTPTPGTWGRKMTALGCSRTALKTVHRSYLPPTIYLLPHTISGSQEFLISHKSSLLVNNIVFQWQLCASRCSGHMTRKALSVRRPHSDCRPTHHTSVFQSFKSLLICFSSDIMEILTDPLSLQNYSMDYVWFRFWINVN